MFIYNDIYTWKGFGGKLKLGHGKCHLRIYDLRDANSKATSHLKPIIIIASDVSDSPMSVKSCAGHIATGVTKKMGINPHRMVYIEYYPEKHYGNNNLKIIPEQFETVDFKWHDDVALEPKWRTLKTPLLDTVKAIIHKGENL